MTSSAPPRAVERALEMLLPRDSRESMLGDLAEEFHRVHLAHGRRRAARWYCQEAIAAAIHGITHRSARRDTAQHPSPQRDNVMTTLRADFRYAVRNVARRPGFSALVIATLALGIGAATAIFSAVSPILFQPLPYPAAERIALVSETEADGSRSNVGFPTYRDLAAQSHAFDQLAAIGGWSATITGAGEPELLTAERVSSPYFRVLGVAPALGRDFLASDDVLNGPHVVILSDALWRRRFGADRTLIGRTIALNGVAYMVIGVMPRTFENIPGPDAELWRPLQYDESLPWACRSCRHLRVIGRLHPGVTTAAAVSALRPLSHTMLQDHPKDYTREGFLVTGLQDDVTRAVRPALVAVLGAVFLLLLIACANVTNLLIARSDQRRGEFAVRAALGAGRLRVVRQLLTESVLFAFCAGVIGLGIAVAGIRGLVAVSPQGLPRAAAIGVHAGMFLFALAVSTVVGLVFGLIPALHATRGDLHDGLQRGSRRTAGGGRSARATLVIAEVALALVLLIGSGLLFRSLRRLFAIAPGFESTGLVTMTVQTAGPRFNDDSATWRFFGQALDAVRQVPGVESAAFTSQLPLSGDFDSYGVHLERYPHDNPQDDPSAFRYAVTAGYFTTMRIPLRRGRLLDLHDVAGAPLAVVINESFARRVLPNQDPIGQHMHLGGTDGPWYTVVGVVGDVRQASLALPQSDAVYITPSQWHFGDNVMSLVVRSRNDAAALAPAVRRAIWSVDKDQPVLRIATMDALLQRSGAERHFALLLFEVFGLVAMVLAAAGIYGVLSGSVAERMREIGVRSALGATRGTILRMIVGDGMRWTGMGILLGIAGSLAASQTLTSLLFGIARVDVTTYGGVVALLCVVAAAACWIPAARAARISPVEALRDGRNS